ncbi:MAG: acetate kinase [Pseudomonadota bacterium]
MSIKKILVINCGSSSVKFSLFDSQKNQLAAGLAEKLGDADAVLSWRIQGGDKNTLSLHSAQHRGAITAITKALGDAGLFDGGIAAIGHRVVHGGEFFSASVVIDAAVMKNIASCSHLAPLHNPANIVGIELLAEQFPQLPQVAVFDTAFHQSLPDYAYTYGLPYQYYKEFGLRRYGFHGTSHRYVSQQAAQRLHKAYTDSSIISAHLGNGCSATAILNGKSIDTTMGLTPLEGLLMGTRSGDIDPSIHQFLADQLHCDLSDITAILNNNSGLFGISGLSNDMRTLCEAAATGNTRAQLAIAVFCYRLAKAIAALAVPLGKIDALVFTGGIGENAATVREQTIKQLSILNMTLDTQKNARTVGGEQGIITTDNSTVAMVIATQEEWVIAQDTLALLDTLS